MTRDVISQFHQLPAHLSHVFPADAPLSHSATGEAKHPFVPCILTFMDNVKPAMVKGCYEAFSYKHLNLPNRI